jgi:hypothetical protein
MQLPCRTTERGRGDAADQTCVFTLLPALVSDCAPLACTFCKRLFRKLCRPEFKDPPDEEPTEAVASAALRFTPFTPFTKFWNVDERVSVAAVGLPFGPSC